MILDWYKYLFYRVYKWRCRRPKTPISQPAFDTVLFISIADAFYVLAILAICTVFSNKLQHIFFDDFGEKKIILYVIAIIFVLMHLYIYLWSGNSKKIIAEYDKSNYKPTKLGTFGVIFYMVFSYLLFVGAGILLAPSIRTHLLNMF